MVKLWIISFLWMFGRREEFFLLLLECNSNNIPLHFLINIAANLAEGRRPEKK
jgi:hypothetical protein